MRRWTTAVGVAAAALMIAGVLGTAGAQTQTPATHTLSVNGAAQRTVASSAPQDTFTVAYRAALDDALDDAKAKADRIAQKQGLTLGAVQALTETSNSVLGGCMFGYGAADSAGATSAPPAAKAPPKANHPRKPKPKRKHKAAARAAQNETYPCPVQASVTVVYAIP
jgi:uncharacterized protein YggE